MKPCPAHPRRGIFFHQHSTNGIYHLQYSTTCIFSLSTYIFSHSYTLLFIPTFILHKLSTNVTYPPTFSFHSVSLGQSPLRECKKHASANNSRIDKSSITEAFFFSFFFFGFFSWQVTINFVICIMDAFSIYPQFNNALIVSIAKVSHLSAHLYQCSYK